MSEVGGKLSWEQDGLMPVQTQNITLYALQRGFCGINYYMTVGGTNFDDWGARQMTTTYDYAAAIAENGLGNNIRAQEYAQTAVQMEPMNMQYILLLNQLQGNTRQYRQTSQQYGNPASMMNCCYSIMLLNCMMSCCCGGGYHYPILCC